MGLNILHLSDLHLNNNINAEDFAAKIHNTSLDHRLSPDIIVVTGDIFNADDFKSADYKSAIDKAVVFFRHLLSLFELNKFDEHLFFVPGNHEIHRESIKNNKPEEQLSRYHEFLARIYAEKWDDIAASVYNKEEACFVKHFIDKKTILIGLNSPRYEKARKDQEKFIETARIGNIQINTIKRQMGSIDGYDDNRVVACLHNNIYNTLEYAPSENIDATCVQDNDSVLSMLSAYNCSLILHGHKHQQKNRRINLTQNIKEKDRLCTIIGGGRSTDSFNYLEIYDKNTDVELHCMEFRDDCGRFILHDDFKVPVSESNWHYSKIIEDAIQSDFNLSINYRTLEEADSNCDPKLIEMFQGVLGSFKEISNNFFPNPRSDINLLYIILGTIHYRSNFGPNNAFIKQSEIFIKKATDELGLSDKVLQMLKVEDACALYSEYEKHKNNISSEHKKALIFLALSIYLSEFFLTIKKRPSEFYRNHIKEKTNYKLDGNDNDIITAISGNTIKFEVNEEHRALEITVKCSTANSHKIVSLIIKEFELILSRFEEDFALAGFKVYYTLPKLTKADIADEKLESYEFAAYIPQLIPLLAGRNIYSEPEAFTRELIQNSIDAVKVREKHEENEIIANTKIELEIEEDSSKEQKYFKITDHGTGMSRYVLERYLTTIGRSFYTSADFKKLEIKYSPISQFGIGFLSCFMLGKQIEVYTTYHDNLNESFFLDIPNFDGCFFIETKNEKKDSPGSSITIWENRDLIETPEKFNKEKIEKYIRRNICNIPFDITLNNEMFIPKFNYYNKLKKETEKANLLFFIPLASDPDDSGNVLVDEKITDHSEHGIYFFKEDKSLYTISKNIIMNNGILVSRSHISEKEMREIHPYLDAVFNFPSYALTLDVSRDGMKKLNGFMPLEYKKFLQIKIRNYLKTNSAKNIEYILWCFLDHNKYKPSKINISCTSKTLNVIMDKYSPTQEFEEFCKMIRKIDKLIEKSVEIRRKNYPNHLEFRNLFHGFMNNHYEISIRNIYRYFDEYSGSYNMDYFKEERILNFQDRFIQYIISKQDEEDNIIALKGYRNLAEYLTNEPSKFISSLILSNNNEYFRRVSMTKSIKNNIEDSIYIRATLMMSILKIFLSTNYSYSDLIKGFSIPFDENSIIEMLDNRLRRR